MQFSDVHLPRFPVQVSRELMKDRQTVHPYVCGAVRILSTKIATRL